MVENFDEWFHDILEQADITDSRYPIKGMAVWRPYGFQIRKHSMNIIKNLLDKDHDEVLFPMLVPESKASSSYFTFLCDRISLKSDNAPFVAVGSAFPARKRVNSASIKSSTISTDRYTFSLSHGSTPRQ